MESNTICLIGIIIMWIESWIMWWIEESDRLCQEEYH